MEAPPIHYAKSADGTSIAYWVLRDGPTAMVQLPYPWSHLRNEWELPEIAGWHRRLGAGRTLIAYDVGGMGLSGRGESDLPPLLRWRDALIAVLDAVGVHRFALLAPWTQAWTAMRYAVKFPERVSQLVLWGAAARGSDLYSDTVRATSEMETVDPQQWARITASSFIGWDAGDVAGRYIEATLGAISELSGGLGTAAHGLGGSVRAFDATGFAAEVQAPTLVLHARENTLVSEESAAGLAAAIPGARLVVLDGESLLLPVGVADQALAAINAFIEETSEPREPVVAPSEAASGAAPGPPYPDGLTAREIEVLRLVAMGATNAEIAERLVISINTVMRHVSHIFDKTGATNRVEATRYAIEHALTE